jgi:4-amino-4-deoxy-L-arabinose transferase-like glycosyltransferase
VVIICLIYGLISFTLFFLLFGGQGISSDDTIGYTQTACNLLHKKFFSIDGITPDYSRTPGYPLFLAAIYLLGGGNNSAVALQILLAVLEIYLFYRSLILIRTPPRLAVAGTILVLFNITSYQYSWNISPDFLFGFLLMLALYLIIKYTCTKNSRFFYLFTLTLNYALLVRPILVYFNWLIILVLLVLYLIKKVPFRYFLAFLLCFLLFWGSWSYRNYKHSGVFIFSTIQNYNMQKYYAPIITASIERISEKEADLYHDKLFAQQYPETNGKSGLENVQVSLLQKKYGLDFLKTHIPQYILANITGLFGMLFAPSKSFMLEIFPSVLSAYLACGIYTLYLAFVYLLYLCGLLFNRKKIFNPVQMYILFLSGYLAAASAIMCHSRFRAPFFTLLLLGATINSPAVIKSVNSLYRKFRNGQSFSPDGNPPL